MLVNIKITNLALINKSSVSFSDGFNVLTGETGAGKSLIVDALVFLTGVRADKTFIKSGEDFSRVEGVFSVDVDNSDINDILQTIGIENEGTIIVSRQFNLNGKNECRINGEIVTLNILRKLSYYLIDIFGQNDSQVLLDSNNHLMLLDNMIELSLRDCKDKLRNELNNLSQINSAIYELGGLDRNREENIRFLEYQIKEIDDANLKIGDEEELKSKILMMQNSEKIHSTLSSISELLDGEFSIESTIKSAINALVSLENFDNDYTIQKDRLSSIRYELQDIVSEIDNKKNSIIYSEEELDVLEDKLILIKDLERKYGNTIEDIFNTRDEFKAKLDKLLNSEEELERLRLNKMATLKLIYELCIKLHQIRVEEISKFKSKLQNELQQLGMKNATFDVSFKNNISLDIIEDIVDENGADRLEFLFSANLGVEPRPLDKIISGGEMSRFMLAFKTLQNSDSHKTCIFDEIDTGIGGEIGVVVGKKICQISRMSQVICITHLAQIASFGDSNFKIEKFENENTTITSVKQLNENEKVVEISRMLGGGYNETSIQHANEILQQANEYKEFIAK